MDVYGFGAAPTVADEARAVVDDAQVIARTLPAEASCSDAQASDGSIRSRARRDT